MTLNKTDGNMYSFVSHTWCPIGGACPHKCQYCYVPSTRARTKYTGKIKLYENNLKTNLGSGNYIFVAHMIDLFADGMPEDMILKVLEQLKKFPDNKYLLQSKNTKRMALFVGQFPKNVILGTTIETNREYINIMGTAPPPLSRAVYMQQMAIAFDTMVTVEPIMRFDALELVTLIDMCKSQSGEFQVNIGADSKSHDLPEPSAAEIEHLKKLLHVWGFNVTTKRNLNRLLK